MVMYDPYFAEDTDGVHFRVRVDRRLVDAYVSRALLKQVYGVDKPGSDCVAVYLQHRAAFDAAVRRRVRAVVPEHVLLQIEDFGQSAATGRADRGRSGA